jgi:hypothetical protein
MMNGVLTAQQMAIPSAATCPDPPATEHVASALSFANLLREYDSAAVVGATLSVEVSQALYNDLKRHVDFCGRSHGKWEAD